MPKIDIPLTTHLNFRANDVTKDAKMVNCYKETVAGKTYAVKRPGKQNYTVTPALPAVGQGLHVFNNNMYAVTNGTLYSITGGTRNTIIAGLNTTNNVSWINTEATTSPHPYMVVHDKVNGYYLDAAGNSALISKMIGAVSLVSGGTGYPASGTFTVTGSGGGAGAGGTYTASSGSITNLVLTSRGSNYVGLLTVTFSGGGSSASAVASYNAFPANPVTGLVYLDGYVFAMDKTATVWQSDLEDPTSWGSINFLTVIGEPDLGVGIAKHYNYIVAFKQWTTEFLYDNANPVGSVLLTNQTARIELGCATGDSIQQLEETVIWMSTTKEGGRGIAMLDGLKAHNISTKAVETFLNASDLSGVYSWVYKISGHTFYGLVLTDQNVTLVYDLNEKEWHMWTTNKAFYGGGENYFECSFVTPFPVNSNNYYVLDAVNGLMFTLSPNYYVDPFGPVTMRIVTQTTNLDTFERKTNSQLTILGDVIKDVINIRHSDDDYNNWSAYRPLDLSLDKPALYNLGSFKRRAYEFLYTGYNPLRLEMAQAIVNGQLGQQG